MLSLLPLGGWPSDALESILSMSRASGATLSGDFACSAAGRPPMNALADFCFFRRIHRMAATKVHLPVTRKIRNGR